MKQKYIKTERLKRIPRTHKIDVFSEVSVLKDEFYPLARTRNQRKLWRNLQPVNRVVTTDTYKRTMSGSSETFAKSFSCYNLAARRSIKEDGINGRYIMAGIEKMLYPWFLNPISIGEVEEAEDFFKDRAQVNKFPSKVWGRVLKNSGYLPIDIYGLPGGQTFLAKDGKHVPMMSVEGIGALVSHLEPHFENIYAPLIQATKARLMRDVVGDQFAEFGLRSDQNENNHITLMMALYVGGGFRLTSSDLAAFVFQDYFKDIGTMGHEYIMSFQKNGMSLEDAQEKAFDEFCRENQRSALLVDTIDTVKSGLPAALRMMKKYRGSGKIIMPRFDSGDVTNQCIVWKKMTLESGLTSTKMIVEDGYTPNKALETKTAYKEAGFNPEDIIVGAGGYFQDGCNRDAASVVYKRSTTEHDGQLEDSLKFSDDKGKCSIPGQIRVYERGNTLVVAQAREEIDGTPLYVPLIKNGRIVYHEDLNSQRDRAENTWNKYDNIEYSKQTQESINSRISELNQIRERL